MKQPNKISIHETPMTGGVHYDHDTSRRAQEAHGAKLLRQANEKRIPWYRRDYAGAPVYAYVLTAVCVAGAVIHFFTFR